MVPKKSTKFAELSARHPNSKANLFHIIIHVLLLHTPDDKYTACTIQLKCKCKCYALFDSYTYTNSPTHPVQGPQRDDAAVLRPDVAVDGLAGREPHGRRAAPQQQRRPTAARHQGGEGRLPAAHGPPLEQGQPTGHIMHTMFYLRRSTRSMAQWVINFSSDKGDHRKSPLS